MKKVVSVLLLILSLYSTGCHRQRPHPNTVRPVTTKLISDSLPVIQFEKQVIDLGMKYLIIMGFVQVPQNMSNALNGALRGAGYTKVS
ncbi:MAG: hypothetical protein GX428_10635, partial [Candidatus Atribacteria bacterium]|nr:hypothetical protein [Candidatus Atribacteria bacterium]